MPTISGSAQTQFSLLGLFTRRYGSFSGKAEASKSVTGLLQSILAQQMFGDVI